MAMATSENAGRTPVGTALKIRVEKMEHNNGGSALRNSIPIKHLSCHRKFDPPTDFPDEASCLSSATTATRQIRSAVKSSATSNLSTTAGQRAVSASPSEAPVTSTSATRSY